MAVPWGAVASGLGSVATSATNYAIAMKQMEFQERMSNTAHRREAYDLEQAGLNRILSVSHGGAQTPPGAAIPVENPAASAISAGREWQQKKQAEASIELIRQQGKQAGTQAALNSSKGLVEMFRAQLLQADLPSAEAKARFDKTPHGEFLRRAHRIKDVFNIFQQVNPMNPTGRHR